MKKTYLFNVLLFVAGLTIGSLFNSFVFSDSVRPPLQSRFKIAAETNAFEFYTFYFGNNGEEVRHGWHYIVVGNHIQKSRYEDGHPRSLDGHSVLNESMEPSK